MPSSVVQQELLQEHHQEFLEGYYFTPSELEKSGPGWLLRAGISQAKPNYHMGPKISPYHYLIFVLDGEGQLTQNGQTYPLRKNDLFALFPNESQEYYTLKESLLLTVWMAFDGRHLGTLLAGAGLLPRTPWRSGAVTEEVGAWFREFFLWHRAHSGRDSDLFRLSMFYRLFGLLADGQDSARTSNGAESWLQRGTEYMQIHYAEGITARQVSDYVGIDRTHFSKKFTARFGLSPGKYMQRLKMNEARRLLMETDYKLAEIAQLVGYPDLFSFSKSFKKAFGHSPSRNRPGTGSGPELPAAFVLRIAELYGKPGEQWLRNAPRIAAYCETRWGIRTGALLSLSGHYMVEAELGDGTEAVLKLGVPGKAIRSELEALQAFQGRGCARLLNAEADRGILLLERVKPGYSLAEACGGGAMRQAVALRNAPSAAPVPGSSITGDDAAVIAAQVIRALHQDVPAIPADSRFESLRQWPEELASLRDRAADPEADALLGRTEALLAWLTATSGPQRLLHGNLACCHLLAGEGDAWTAIHPKGILGEAEYEAAPFLLSQLPGEEAVEAIGRKARLLADALGWDVRRLLAWSLCHCVLAAYRSWNGPQQLMPANASAGSAEESVTDFRPEGAEAVQEAFRIASGLIRLLKEHHHIEGKRG
ncbi:MAG: AraC family transcriptional regulator [Paenibacillaceae bacterium]|jgi:AraC-like DNA-binding protein/streptomycin 6-kinase|nr:AraC family transcriptional regulator [Paenibacillaceae bacterium]